MFKRFQSTQSLWSRRGKWLFLLVIVLLFTLVATTAAQDEAEDPDPPVPEPYMNDRIFTPDGVEETWTFFASADTFLSSANPNSNYGTWTTVKAGYDQSTFQAMRMMFKFNLSSIPQNSVINSASLSVYQTQSVPSNDVNMGLQAAYMRSDWTETGVTWNNANYLGGDVIGVGDNTSSLGWKSIEVTSVVHEWVSGARTNYGFIVTGMEDPVANRSRTFYSRQQNGFQPRMTISFNQSCDNVPPTAWVETLPQWSTATGTVRWNGTDSAPAGCEPVGINHYDIQYNVNSGNWTNWQQNTTATSANFHDVQNGQTYYLRARATDNAGNLGAWPSSAQAWTTIDSIAPTATMNGLPTYSLGTTFNISWTGSDNSGGSGIATYDVQYQQDDGPWRPYVTGTSATSTHFGPVQNGSVYAFKVRATDVAGNSQPWSEDAQTSTIAVTHPIAVVTPFDPIILGPTAPITDSFEVNWQTYTVSGVTVTGVQIQYKVNNGNWTIWGTFNGNSAVFDDLVANDATYYFEARAITNAVDVEDEQFSNTAESLKIVDLQAPFIETQAYTPLVNNSETD